MADREYFLGMDIGGTNGRMKICDDKGEILGEFCAPGCSINTDGPEKSRQRYQEMVLPALKKLKLTPQQFQRICLAVSGIDSPADEKACRDSFEEMGFLKERIMIVNDCEIFLYLTDGPSMVAVSGTGSICYGRDKKGKIYRTGGWNHIISDEGSGFDMGLKVLQATGDALDGRISCPILCQMVTEQTGLDSLEALNRFVNENLMEKSRIAKLALTAYQAAQKGDEMALRIHETCAGAVFALIKDTAEKMKEIGDRKDVSLYLWGSILEKNGIVREMVKKKAEEALPGIEIKIPTEPALDIALRTAIEGGRKR